MGRHVVDSRTPGRTASAAADCLQYYARRTVRCLAQRWTPRGPTPRNATGPLTASSPTAWPNRYRTGGSASRKGGRAPSRTGLLRSLCRLDWWNVWRHGLLGAHERELRRVTFAFDVDDHDLTVLQLTEEDLLAEGVFDLALQCAA